MATTGMQLLGLIMSIVGWVSGAIVCSLPLWRVTAFIGNNIVTAQIIWEGLWMTCIVQSTGQIQCKVYDSLLALPSDMQAARGLTVFSVLLCGLALSLGVLGVKCTKCVGVNSLKARIARISGVLFAVAGFLYLVPVCWTAHSIIRDFYDPHVAAPHKRELGPALYIGWGPQPCSSLEVLCCMPGQVPLVSQALPLSAVEKVVPAGHLPHKLKVTSKVPESEYHQVSQIHPKR